MSYSYVDSALEIRDKFSLPKEIISSPEVQAAAKQGFINCLSTGEIDRAIKIKDNLNLPEATVQEAIKQGFIDRLSYGDIDRAIKIKDNLSLPKEIISSPEVQAAAKQGFINLLSDSRIDNAIKIKDKFNLPEATVQAAAKQGFINYLSFGLIDHAIKIKDKFNLPEATVQATAKQEFIIRLSKCQIREAIEIKDKFNLPEATIQEAARQGFINSLSEGYIGRALKIGDIFKLPKEIISSPEIQEAAKQGFIDCLSNGTVDTAIIIRDTFYLPEATVQETAKQGFINRLSKGQIDNAIEIKDNFNPSVSTQEIIQQIPALAGLIEDISQLAPGLKAQVEKSSDLAIELCRFIENPDQLIKTIKEAPFLIDAIANNTRFSSRLLIKYPEFDELSQENIEKLFSSKKKIMEQNPELDPESLEFRQLMQEELKEFKDNPGIIAAIKEQKINLDNWLNYSETSYFNLATGGSEIAFSEKIRTPIERIKETIGSYAYTIKSVLKEYRPEMEKFEIILEDSKPIKEQIAKMEIALEQAKTKGNEKKVQGIEKGLESQKGRLNNLKKGFLWDKLTGEIAAFQRLKNDCFNAQTRLLEAENKLTEALSGKMPSGKEIQEIKQKMAQAKEELRNKFSDLEGRIEDFKTELPNLISPCLGQARSEALIQEIDQKVAEQFNHYNSDRTALANMFSERGDKETEQLESRPMSIFVWARNPDIDLYQGNYSPCCICIDSAHMGAESTIADYNTDLGIQIVNIWDETKNEPITAAWCWLGENEEGEKVLVIDNIESNTLFSSNFSEQLSKELFEYIKNYARKIGVDKVVLGKANNDLPTSSELSKMADDSSSYSKIGESNRSDGYFLEAEGRGVKLVWDKKQDQKIVKQKKEKVKAKPTVKYKNIAEVDLTTKDFDAIRQLETKIYGDTGLAQGRGLIEDIKAGKGLEYSIIIKGEKPKQKKAQAIGYLVAVEDTTDEGDPSIYMEDIAVLPEAQRQGVGWELLKTLVNKLKAKSQKDGRPILLDMHLREGSQALLRNYNDDLENMGAKLIEEAYVPDYYDEGEDALYQVYEVNG
ncbi:MAG: GNAT family N-acetyltransferase [Candidatus Falkowbacteria bacterium]|nr:GNAT family N-acetyltransferase [Candidatus Falkowbacteria bacterium]